MGKGTSSSLMGLELVPGCWVGWGQRESSWFESGEVFEVQG